MDIIDLDDLAVRTAETSPAVALHIALEQAYGHFNDKLIKPVFGVRLPTSMVIAQRRGKKTLGYFASDKMTDGTTKLDEIALSPRHFRTRTVEEVLATLVHEMVHQYRHYHGKPMLNGYHDKAWGRAMKDVGLYPSNTGKPGGRETGVQMTHYIIEGGPYARAFAELDAKIEWGDVFRSEPEPPPAKPKRVKFVCPRCGWNYLAVLSANGKGACIPCGGVPMVIAQALQE